MKPLAIMISFLGVGIGIFGIIYGPISGDIATMKLCNMNMWLMLIYGFLIDWRADARNQRPKKKTNQSD